MNLHPAQVRRTGALLAALTVAVALVLSTGNKPAAAAIVPTVPLGTSANYSVLAGETVTNTGLSVLAESVGLSPGTSITGFPPGVVTPPAVIDQTNPAAAQAQLDLTTAYLDAAGRPLTETTTAQLGGLTLIGGVYAGPSKSPLEITGPLVLDGQNDPDSVFIFQTDSTLTTASSSTVTLINGALECNVFWQVGSSATLGTGSVFTGNILALTSITVTTGAVVHGRALARNGAVTLDTNVFDAPNCTAQVPPETTTTAPSPTTTAPSPTTTAPSPTTTAPATGVPDVPRVVGPPRTGAAPAPGPDAFPWLVVLPGVAAAGGAGWFAARRHRLRTPVTASDR